MAAVAGEESKDAESGAIPPWAEGEKLRKVEENVLIPKKMREKARENCRDFVEGRDVNPNSVSKT